MIARMFSGRFRDPNRWVWLAAACLATCLLVAGESTLATDATRPPPGVPADADRSPVDLALDPNGKWLATANQTSDTVSLVDIASGRLLDEIPVGRRPAAIQAGRRGGILVVSCSYGGEVIVLQVQAEGLRIQSRIQTGFQPHGIAIAPDNRTAYVALTDANQIALLDLAAGKITDRIDVGRWPRYVALTPDGNRLAVGTSGDRGVSIVDTPTRKLSHIERFVGLNIGHLQCSSDGQYAYFPWMVYRRNPISPSNIRRGWVLASRIARVRMDEPARREAISLDPQGQAIADPHGIDLTRDEQTLVVSASGTQELLIYRLPALPLEAHGGPDHIDPSLLSSKDLFDRIPLGGRPMGLEISADDRTVYIANYFDNSVQQVNLETRKLERRMELGRARHVSLVRQGEMIFFDGKRSLDQWYSCHSCHYEGGTNAVVMDTDNDGTRFTFKTVLPLFGLNQTAPWTWHGWQTSLPNAMRKSVTSTMQGKPPTDQDVEALVAYLSALDPPPNSAEVSPPATQNAIARGRKIFHSDGAACASCHSGPRFTDGQNHDVGLGSSQDRYDGFNTPSLEGVGRKVLLLHDGRSSSLEDLLTGPHSPAAVSGTDQLAADDLADLIAFLQSL